MTAAETVRPTCRASGLSAYGVPWPYAGQEVQVQASEERVEIWAGPDRIAVHPRAHAPGQRFVWPGQWDGLPATSPRRRASPVIVQVLDPGVEVCPLTAYEALLGVVNGHGRP